MVALALGTTLDPVTYMIQTKLIDAAVRVTLVSIVLRITHTVLVDASGLVSLDSDLTTRLGDADDSHGNSV